MQCLPAVAWTMRVQTCARHARTSPARWAGAYCRSRAPQSAQRSPASGEGVRGWSTPMPMPRAAAHLRVDCHNEARPAKRVGCLKRHIHREVPHNRGPTPRTRAVLLRHLREARVQALHHAPVGAVHKRIAHEEVVQAGKLRAWEETGGWAASASRGRNMRAQAEGAAQGPVELRSPTRGSTHLSRLKLPRRHDVKAIQPVAAASVRPAPPLSASKPRPARG